MSLKDFENPRFDPEQYVEQLAWRVQGGDSAEGRRALDARLLLNVFENTIDKLKHLNARLEDKIVTSETDLGVELKGHGKRVAELQEMNKTAFVHFQELDEHISNVATKVVHLGDQLEGVNTPRARAEEAQKLIGYFSDFLDEYGPQSEVFNDPFRLQEAADIIQKLQLISQELPPGQFDKPKKKIQDKYNQIEDDLIEDFRQAFKHWDPVRMRELAGILTHFKGYNRCVDTFIEESQANTIIKSDVYEDLISLCRKVNTQVHEVFSSPESVMGKFVLNLYHEKLQKYIGSKLDDQDDLEAFLRNLHDLYQRTGRLTSVLTEYKLGSDAHLLNRLTKHIFGKYLDLYIEHEIQHLKDKMGEYLKLYYEGLGHNKRVVQHTGGLHDLQNKLRTIQAKGNINIGPTAPLVDYRGETFLSQEVALNLLHESKQAFIRCQLLSQSNQAENAALVFDTLVDYLCSEHIDYALEIGLQGIASHEPKVQPHTYFFDIGSQANAIFHLLERQFSDILVPLISASPIHSECVMKKRNLMEQMEVKVELGLDKTLATVCGWIKFSLSSEQKKADFKRDSESGPIELYSPACARVIPFVEKQVDSIKLCLDGKNVNAVLMDFGVRFHRVIFDHLQQFQYNSLGAMLVICDVNEYRRLVKTLKVPMVNTLFEMLHALCNLLVVVPENLKQVVNGEQLSGLDTHVVMSFVQLRTDFKTAKIGQLLR